MNASLTLDWLEVCKYLHWKSLAWCRKKELRNAIGWISQMVETEQLHSLRNIEKDPKLEVYSVELNTFVCYFFTSICEGYNHVIKI